MYYDGLPVYGFIGKVEKAVRTGQHKWVALLAGTVMWSTV
jgi:hypothetical protein